MTLGFTATPREMQVLAVSLTSGSIKEAATELGITEGTAKHTLTKLYRKLGLATGDTRLAALRLGWVQVPPEFFRGLPVRTRSSRSLVVRLCELCEATFFARRAKIEAGEGRFCSKACSAAGKPRDGGPWAKRATPRLSPRAAAARPVAARVVSIG